MTGLCLNYVEGNKYDRAHRWTWVNKTLHLMGWGSASLLVLLLTNEVATSPAVWQSAFVLSGIGVGSLLMTLSLRMRQLATIHSRANPTLSAVLFPFTRGLGMVLGVMAGGLIVEHGYHLALVTEPYRYSSLPEGSLVTVLAQLPTFSSIQRDALSSATLCGLRSLWILVFIVSILCFGAACLADSETGTPDSVRHNGSLDQRCITPQSYERETNTSRSST